MTKKSDKIKCRKNDINNNNKQKERRGNKKGVDERGGGAHKKYITFSKLIPYRGYNFDKYALLDFYFARRHIRFSEF